MQKTKTAPRQSSTGLIAAILSVAIVGTVTGVKTELNETFTSVSDTLGANNTVTP